VLQISTVVVLALTLLVVTVSSAPESGRPAREYRGPHRASAAPVAPDQPVELFDGRSGRLDARESPGRHRFQVYWSVKDGVMHANRSLGGYARTNVSYRDYALHVEWRWPKDPKMKTTPAAPPEFYSTSTDPKSWRHLPPHPAQDRRIRRRACAQRGQDPRQNPIAKDPVNLPAANPRRPAGG